VDFFHNKGLQLGLVNKPFSLLIKPASTVCNQDCAYCFYLSRSNLYPRVYRRMTAKILKRLISSYMRTWRPHYVFTWQGGEPTLLGIDFFKQAVRLQQKYGEPGSLVSKGSFKDVMKGIDCLKIDGVEFNILTLVSQANVKKGKEVYKFFCDKGFFYHQYIECVEFDKKAVGMTSWNHLFFVILLRKNAVSTPCPGSRQLRKKSGRDGDE
jgi:uncharacterized protein